MSKKRKAERAARREQAISEKEPTPTEAEKAIEMKPTSAEPEKSAEIKPIPAEPKQQTLKELLEPLTKEQKTLVLKDLMAIKQDEKTLTEAERVVYWRFLKSFWEPGTWLTETSETEREGLIEEVKSVAKMTEVEQDEFWKEQEGLNEMMSKAVPMALDMFRKGFTSPQSLKSLPLTEDQKEAYKASFDQLKNTADESTLHFGLTLIEQIFDASKNKTEPLKSYVKIDSYLRILLGDSYLSPLPLTIQGNLEARGISKDMKEMSFDEIMNGLLLPEKESWFDTVMPTLDMIFQERYGWPEGTAKMKTISELCLALEHAIEQDYPKKKQTVWDKPNIWDMTQGKKKVD